jgi:membrane-bound lytic murein transglycosylase B
VETYYGRITGNHRVLDALATLAFDFPPGRRDRSAFFADELEAFFVWCAREGVDPQLPKGSYAGAMGLPQFMPSSVLRWALDFDGDGHIDLHGSPADVVGSVAHYLASFGWQRGQPTHYAVVPPPEGEARTQLLAPDIKPTFSVQQLLDAGALLPDAARQHEGPLALVLLENGGEPPSYVAGTQNFYVVTRYNWSSYYALAVIELGAAVRAVMPAR